MIRVENRKTYRGDGIFVGRPSPLGNPYSHLSFSKAEFRVATRDEAVDNYRGWLEEKLDSNNPASRLFLNLLDQYEKTGELVLICFCKPERCHADIIKEMIEECAGKV